MPRKRKVNDFDKRFNQFWSDFLTQQKAIYDEFYSKLSDAERNALDKITVMPEPLNELFPKHNEDIAKSFYTRFRKNPELLERWFEISSDPMKLMAFLRDFDRERYFPAPTSTALVVPAFGLGLQKTIEPKDVQDGYETKITYLSVKKPKSETSIQLRLFDTLDEKIAEYEKLIKKTLTPFGTKCFYYSIRECGRNNRQPWFTLNTNDALDALGYTRRKDGVHKQINRKRLIDEYKRLMDIEMNIEREEIARPGQKTIKALRIRGPIIGISPFYTEEWEKKPGQELEKGTHIADHVPLYIHPMIYEDIQDFYTIIPEAFLKIDTGRRGHAIQIYPFLATQWRIGYAQYHGVHRGTMKRLLTDTGLMVSYPKRQNQRRDFIDKIKDTLQWLQKQPEFWIDDVKFDFKKRSMADPLLDQIVETKITKSHPLNKLKIEDKKWTTRKRLKKRS